MLLTLLQSCNPATIPSCLLLSTLTGEPEEEFCEFPCGNTQAGHPGWLETALWEAERKRGNAEVKEGINCPPKKQPT